MTEAFPELPSAFGGLTADFAVHPIDRKGAVAYLRAALDHNLTWRDAENDVRTYLKERGCGQAHIDEQVERARRLLQPWLI